MAQIDDLLEQAEAQDGSSSWVLITKYQRKEFYVDSDRAVNVVGRKIEAIREEVSVQGENHSQYIEFIMDRYYDGIDIAEQTLAIHYEVGDVSDEDAPINVYKNDTQIKFGWVVESNLTQYATIVEFCIWARGTLADGNTYVLKTLPQKYEIQRGLTLAGGIVEPSTNWYLQFALTMDEKVAQAATSADKAVQAASSVDGVVEVVTIARDEVVQKASTVDTQHTEVESWHQEAEQFRNEAEQFRNQAEAITDIGLAEEGKPGIVQPDGVTTKVDADGKLTVIGGGGASEEAIRALEEFTQQLDQDISTLDTELEQTNQQLQSTTDKVDDVQESIEAGFKKQARGEEIHTTDAVDGKVLEFALFGKAKQQTTSGKNLLENKATNKTEKGVTYTVNNDKSVTITGILDSGQAESYQTLVDGEAQFLQKGVEYIVSRGIRIVAFDNESNIVYDSQGIIFDGDYSYTRKESETRLIIRINGAILEKTLPEGTVIYPMISVEGGEYEPYTGGIPSPNPNYPQEIETAGASGSVAVKSVGEQLFDGVLELGRLANDSGNVMDAPLAIRSANYIEVTGGDTITISNDKGYANYVYEYNANKEYLGYTPGTSLNTLTLKSDTKYIKFRTKESETENDLSAKFMVNKGATALPYEPYKEALSTVPTPNGLSGIKVSSGGNYTDENGQQWITDEIVRYADGSGEYIRRIGKTVFDGSSDEEWKSSDFFDVEVPDRKLSQNVICSHYINEMNWSKFINGNYIMFAPVNHSWLRFNNSDFDSLEAWKENLNSNPITVYYELATPSTTPLTSEQISEIEKLSMFNPVTNISNDADCGMSVTYATLQEALMLQEALNGSKANAQEIASVKEEIVDVKQDLSDTTSRVESIEERAGLGITETASGEEIHLTDSAEGKAVEYSLYGKSTQNTTEGNQLFDAYALDIKTNTSLDISDNGYTITAKGGKGKSYTCSEIILPIDEFKGKTLYAKYDGYSKSISDSVITVQFIVEKNDGTASYPTISTTEKSFIIPEDLKSLTLGIYTNNSSNVLTEDNTLVVNGLRISFVANSKWEEYTGGMASPNPSYPQEIEVSGESYNLLENTATSKTVSGVEFVVNEDKSITANGTATARIEYAFNTFELGVGEYIYSGCQSGGSNDTYRLALYFASDSTYFIDLGSGVTFNNTSARNVMAYAVINSGTKVDNVVFKPMIRKASVKNNRYMPYGVSSVGVKSCRKNIVDATNNTWESTEFYDKEIIKSVWLSVGKYTLSWEQSATLANVTRNTPLLGKVDSFKETTVYQSSSSNRNLSSGRYSWTFDITEEDFYGFRYWIHSPSTEVTISDIQLERGAETPYEPYKESKAIINGEFAGIKVTENGNYTDQNGQQWICDEIVKYADGSGEYIQRVGTDRITTTDSFITQSNGGLYSSDIYTSKPFDSMGKSTTVMCNYYNNSGNGWESKEPCIVTRTNNVSLRIYWQKEITNVSQAIEFMKNNEVIVKYILATPIYTQLTAEEIAEIEKLHTFYPITNISNDFDCGMRIEYVGDSIITTNTEIPVVAQDGELESGDNIVVLFGKIKRMLENLNSRLSTLEQNSKTIVYSDTEPETVEENTIVMVYETEE